MEYTLIRCGSIMLQSGTYLENWSALISNTPILLSTGVSILLTLLYYSFFFYKHKNTGHPSIIERTSPPDQLSPAAIRYLWLSYFDSNCLLAAILSAVVKNCYRVHWDKDFFYVSLVNFSRIALLTKEEKAALSSNGSLFQQQMRITHQRDRNTDKAELRMEKVLQKRFHSYFTRVKEIIFGGMLLSICFLTINAYLFLPDLFHFISIYIIIIYPVLSILTYLTLISYVTRSWIKFTLMLISMVGLGLVLIWLESHFSSLLFPLFIPHIFLHLVAYQKLPKHTTEGHRIKIQIEEFRNYLQNHILNLPYLDQTEMHLLPYLVALEVHFENSNYFATLLRNYPPSKGILSWFDSYRSA